MMISLPPGEIRIGLPPKAKRARKKRETARRQALAAGQAWRNHMSNSQGCHPSQVEEYRSFIKERGLTDVQVTNDGDMLFSSRRGMKEWAKSFGRHNVDETS